MAVIKNLLNADLTYLKLAKSLVVTTFPGSILQRLSAMIEVSSYVKIISPYSFGLTI